jgi:hypothetical protein
LFTFTSSALADGDVPPQLQIHSVSTDYNHTYTITGYIHDADSTSWTGRVDYGDGTGEHDFVAPDESVDQINQMFSVSHYYVNKGTYNVTVTITDNQGATGTITEFIIVDNPPQVAQLNGATLTEGGTYSEIGSFIDTDSTEWTGYVNYGDGTGDYPLSIDQQNHTFQLSHVYKDNNASNAPYLIEVKVRDILTVGSDTYQMSSYPANTYVTVSNIAPTPGAITAPSNPVPVNTAITASANFTDPGVLDMHTATWNWGDGTSTSGTVTESNGSGSVSDSHTYTAPGVYTIALTVIDNDGDQTTATFQYVSVYDSTSSFVGGRSYNNPASASPSTTGKVSFGISAKYTNTTLTGNVKLNLRAAAIDFVSTSLTSLVTSNGRAYLKGLGTLNGISGYTFLVTGIDGNIVGGSDRIRFQVKDASGTIVYDSQPGAAETDDPTTIDATGNIRVH